MPNNNAATNQFLPGTEFPFEFNLEIIFHEKIIKTIIDKVENEIEYNPYPWIVNETNIPYAQIKLKMTILLKEFISFSLNKFRILITIKTIKVCVIHPVNAK